MTSRVRETPDTRRPDRPPGGELARFQDLFQRALMTGDLAILDHILDSSKENRKALFAVYANAYVGRLVDVLKTNHEKTTALLGDDEMLRLGRQYVREHPSTNPNARRFGDAFPAFLRARLGGDAGLAASELAGFEKALNDVFDAPDATPLALADLSALSAEDWPGVVFSPLASTRRIDLESNASEIWRALNKGEVPPAIALREEPDRLLVFRHQNNSHFRELGYEEAMMWDEMRKGLAFAGLCEMVAMQGGEDGAAARAGGYLHGWIAAGVLSGPERVAPEGVAGS